MTGSWAVHGQDTLPRLFRHVVKERGELAGAEHRPLDDADAAGNQGDGAGGDADDE